MPASVTTWSALRRAGHSEAHIRAEIVAGRWRRWGFAIVVHNGPLSPHERWFVARAHCGRSAVLTSFTSLEAFGLRGWERDPAHVLLAANHRVSTRCPVPLRAHRTRGWLHVRRARESPIQVPHQALLRAAAVLPGERAACGLVAAAVQQDVVAAADVRRALTVQSSFPHRRAVVLALADIEQGADALSEIDFVRLCRRWGLPPPERQAVRRDPTGRRRYLDASWTRPDGRTLAVEVDGALHLDQRRWWADQARQNELVLADHVVLRFPSAVVRTDEATVAAQLRRGLLM